MKHFIAIFILLGTLLTYSQVPGVDNVKETKPVPASPYSTNDIHDQLERLYKKIDSLGQDKDTLPGISILSPYNLALGTNFDFIDGVDVKDLYFNISTFVPDIMKISISDKRRSLGIHTGVRKSFSTNYDTFYKQVTQTTKEALEDGFQSTVITSDRFEKLSLTNTNFYFNPILTLREPQQSQSCNVCNSVYLFLSLDFDVMLQVLDWTYTYDTLSVIQTPINSEEFSTLEIQRNLPTETYDQTLYSLGVGMPFFIERDRVLFYGKPVIGYNKKKRNKVGNQESWDIDSFYGKLEFEIIEKAFGLTLRAEYRFFGFEGAPFLSFNIAKYINVKQFIEAR